MMKLIRVSLLFFALHCLPALTSASDTASPQPSDAAQNALQATSREELLLFYEEKDLVAATRRKTPLRKAPAIATVITADEIRNMGARNLVDILKMVPGIGVSVDELGRHMVEVRGIRTTLSEKILVMMDGHRLNESYTGSAFANLYSDLTVENIKQVEIIRGPGSALYGANAFVAVINIVTKGADDINGTNVTLTGGSFNTRKANVLGSASNDDFELVGSVDYLDSDGPKLLIEADRLAAAGSPYTTTPGNAHMNVEKKDVFLKASFGDFSFRGQYLDKHRGAYIGYAYALTDESLLQYNNYWGELGYSKMLNNDISLKLNIFLDQFDLSSKFEFFPEGSFGSPDGVISKSDLIDRTYGSEMQLEHKLFEGNQLIYGALYKKIKQFDVTLNSNFDLSTNPPTPLGSYQDISSSANFNKDAEREIFALFVQDEWSMKDSLNLTAGVRYDNYSDFGDTVNPRFGAVWSFTEKGEIKLLYGKAFRAPNFKELYDQNNAFYVGNPDLKPEKIETYETGIGYKPVKHLRINGNYFFSRIDDLISYDTSVSPAVAVNRGRAEVNGVEIEIENMYNSKDYWRLCYAYQNPENADTGERLPYVPTQRATTGINYALFENVVSHVDVLWTGARPRPAADTRPKAAPYTTVDLTLTAQISESLDLRTSVHNLFDRRYKDPDTSGSLQFIPNDFPREGISALVDITYRF